MRRAKQLRRNPALQFLLDDLFIVRVRVVRREWSTFDLYMQLVQMGLAIGNAYGGGDPDRWSFNSCIHSHYLDSQAVDQSRMAALVSPKILAVERIGGWDAYRWPNRKEEAPAGLWSPCTAIVRVA